MLQHVAAWISRNNQELEYLQRSVLGRLAGPDEPDLHVPTSLFHGNYSSSQPVHWLVPGFRDIVLTG